MVSIGRNGWGYFEGDSVDLKLRSWVPSKAEIVSSAVAVGVFREDVPTSAIGKGCWEQGLTVSSRDFVARAIAKKEGGSVAALHASNNSLVSLEGSNARLYAESAVDRTDARVRYTVAAARVENGATLVVSPATQFNLQVGINDKAAYNDQLRSYGLKVEAGYARIQSHQTNIEVKALSNAAGINIRPNPADEDKGGGADVPPSVVLAGNRTNIWVTSKNRDAYGIYSAVPEGWKSPLKDVIKDESHPEWRAASESFWNVLAVGNSLNIQANAKRDAVGVYVEDGSVAVLGSRNTTIRANGERSAAAFGGEGKIILAGNLNYTGPLLARPASSEKRGTTLEVAGGYMRLNSQGQTSAGIPGLNRLSIFDGGRVDLQDLYVDHNSGSVMIYDGGVLRVNRTFSRTNDNDPTGAAPGHQVASDFSIRRGGTLEISASALESAAITAGMVLRPGGMIRVFGYDQLAAETGPLTDERLNALRNKLILGLDSARGKSDGLIDFGNDKLGFIDLSHPESYILVTRFSPRLA